MNIEDYIKYLQSQRDGYSFAFMAERCDTSETAPYRIRLVQTPVMADETCVLVLAGTGGRGVFTHGYNSILKETDNFIKSNKKFVGKNIRVCVAVCDFGRFHMDKTARNCMFYQAYFPNKAKEIKYDISQNNPQYYQETFNPQYIQDIFNINIVPRMSDKNGTERLPLDTALKNIRRLNIVSHCHGTYVALELVKIMTDFMKKIGYNDVEINQIKSQFFVFAYNPAIPKGFADVPIISLESAHDHGNDFKTLFDEWLFMENMDFGTTFYRANSHLSLVYNSIFKKTKKTSSVLDEKIKQYEQNKGLSEHGFIGFVPKENMSRGAKNAQRIMNNCIQNVVENSLAQNDDVYKPMKNIQSIMINNFYDWIIFCELLVTQRKLNRKFSQADIDKINRFADFYHSIPRCEL